MERLSVVFVSSFLLVMLTAASKAQLVPIWEVGFNAATSVCEFKSLVHSKNEATNHGPDLWFAFYHFAAEVPTDDGEFHYESGQSYLVLTFFDDRVLGDDTPRATSVSVGGERPQHTAYFDGEGHLQIAVFSKEDTVELLRALIDRGEQTLTIGTAEDGEFEALATSAERSGLLVGHAMFKACIEANAG